MKNNYERQAAVFKALSDPKRVMIVQMLSEQKMCACKILEFFDLSQSTLSHHMKILCDAGLVHATPVGKWMHYSLNRKLFQDVASFFSDFSKSTKKLNCKSPDETCGCESVHE